MFIIDFRNKNVSEYRFSVMGNSNVDKVHLYSLFTQYATGANIYLKIRSHDEDYVDKIAISSEDISIEDGALLCKWTMGAVSTQCKKVYLQLQFEKEGDIIAQTGIVGLTLADTINVEQEIIPIYPQVLKRLQEQIDTLKAESFAGASGSYASDTLTLLFRNKDNETLTNIQIAIPTSNRMRVLDADEIELYTLDQLFEMFGRTAFIGMNDHIFSLEKKSNNLYKILQWSNHEFSTAEDIVGTETLFEAIESESWTYNVYITTENLVDFNKNYGVVFDVLTDGGRTIADTLEYVRVGRAFMFTDNNGNNIGYITRNNDQYTFHAWNKDGFTVYQPASVDTRIKNLVVDTQIDFALKNSNDLLYYYTKSQIDSIINTIKSNAFMVADYQSYPTLEDWLDNFEGEDGIIYLYPIDTSDLTKGYYLYIWETQGNDSWICIGTTQIDLSNYYQKNANLEPATDNSYSLGTEAKRFNNVYLTGGFFLGNPSGEHWHIYKNYTELTFVYTYGGSASIPFKINGSYAMADVNFYPATTNARDLGSSDFKWKDLYLAGVITNGSVSIAVDEIANTNNLLATDQDILDIMGE